MGLCLGPAHNINFSAHHAHRVGFLPIQNLRAFSAHGINICWGRGHRSRGGAEIVVMVTEAKDRKRNNILKKHSVLYFKLEPGIDSEGYLDKLKDLTTIH